MQMITALARDSLSLLLRKSFQFSSFINMISYVEKSVFFFSKNLEHVFYNYWRI